MSDYGFPLSFAMYTQGLPFHGGPIENQSLGGSESAVWFLSRELAKLGHHVEVYCQCPHPGDYAGVWYYSVDDFNRMAMAKEWDVFVAVRFFTALALPLRAKQMWLALHDQPGAMAKQAAAHCFQTDQIIPLSDFHRDSWVKEFDGFAPKMWQSRNGVDLALMRKYGTAKRIPTRLIYASRPERGLDYLLAQIWPQLREFYPFELVICGYDMHTYDFPPHLREFYRQMDTAITQTPGVTNAGPLTKAQFYKVLSSCAAMVYPCSFEEISPLRGDAIIDMPSSRETIENLWRQNRQDFWVWSYSHELAQMTLVKARRVVKTRINAPMLTMRMKPTVGCKARCETSLTLTPDHEIMLRDGTYRRADQLAVGDRLMPFARTPGFGRFKYKGGPVSKYWYVSRSNLGDRVPEHRYVAELMLGRPLSKREVVDHIDGNTDNNDPANLQIWGSNSEHKKDHWVRYSEEEKRRRIEEKVGYLHAYDASLTIEEMHAIKRKAALQGWANRRSRQQWEENHVVVAIEPADTADAYCMEVENTHNFVANGIVVHNCINALEAMALGVPVITSDAYALKETIPYDRVPGTPHDPGYAERFVNRTLNVLQDEPVAQRLRHQGRKWVEEKYQWSQVAKEWEERAYALFAERFHARGRRIAETLLFNSDVVAAHHLAVASGFDDLEAETQIILDNHHRDPEVYSAGGHLEVVPQTWENPGAYVTQLLSALPLPVECLSVLDVGCGGGQAVAAIAKARPDALVHGVDFSPLLIAKARELAREHNLADHVQFIQADFLEEGFLPPQAPHYDVVVCTEVLEHIIDYVHLIRRLERWCRPGGRIFLTVPSGAWESYSYQQPDMATDRPHVHHFEQRDLAEIFGEKVDFHVEYLSARQASRGDLLGWWIISYTNAQDRPTGHINYQRKGLTTVPRNTIAACLIVKNEEDHIVRCIKSFIDVVDEIQVWDCASTDRTMEIVERFDGRYWPKVYYRHLNIDPDNDGLGNFGFWRNQSIGETQADWCFVPGTPIRTRTGFKPIETIRIGDEVLTHTGLFRTVQQLFARPYEGKIRWIQPSHGPEPIGMTPNHSVLATKNFGCYIVGKFCFPECRRQWRAEDWKTKKSYSTLSPNCQQGYRGYELGWQPAEALEKADTVVYQSPLPEQPIASLTVDVAEWVRGDWFEIGPDWLKPKNNHGKIVPRFIQADEGFWRLCGYYLAEGHVSDNNWTVGFSFHEEETTYHDDVCTQMRKYFRLEGAKKEPDGTKGVQLIFASRVVSEFLGRFLGCGADNKRLPDCALNIPAQQAFQAFVGFWRGDGTQHPDSFKAVSNSRLLIYQMRDILLRLQVVAGIYRHDPKRTRAYLLSVGGSGLDRLAQFGMVHPFIAARAEHLQGGIKQGGWTDGERLYAAIRDISETHYEGIVYNLGVEEDNSYTAGDMVVHNCFWIDGDEVLVDARNLRKYANDASLFNGYVIKQNHMQLHPDGSLPADEPQRLFRNHRGYQFFGVIHEQVAASLNEEIVPSLVLPDVDILHYGYLTQEETRRKCVERNMPLVRKDRLRHPDRMLGPLLVLRDYVNLAQFAIERTGGRLNEQATTYLCNSVMLYLEHYASVTHKYHEYAARHEQAALRFLGANGIPVKKEWGIPFEVKIQLALGVGGTDGRPLPPLQSRWFSGVPELMKYLQDEIGPMVTPLWPGGIKFTALEMLPPRAESPLAEESLLAKFPEDVPAYKGAEHGP